MFDNRDVRAQKDRMHGPGSPRRVVNVPGIAPDHRGALIAQVDRRGFREERMALEVLVRAPMPAPARVGQNGLPGGVLAETPAPLPVENPGGREECCFSGIREEGRASFAGYRRTGGYAGLNKAVKEMAPGDVLETIDRSGLAGRGGAGFPT